MAYNRINPILPLFLGVIISSIVVVGPVFAKTKSSRWPSTAESLNEQELQKMSAVPVSSNCDSRSPESLSAFVQLNQDSKNACNEVQVQPVSPPSWTLFSGSLVGKQIVNWGLEAGWHVIWQCNKDWVVPNSAEFQGDFVSATGQVLEDLAAEGAPVHGTFYTGNHTLVITDGGQ